MVNIWYLIGDISDILGNYGKEWLNFWGWWNMTSSDIVDSDGWELGWNLAEDVWASLWRKFFSASKHRAEMEVLPWVLWENHGNIWGYPLVNIQKASSYGTWPSRNSWFTHHKWWFSLVM
jgi:hypothetical protein